MGRPKKVITDAPIKQIEVPKLPLVNHEAWIRKNEIFEIAKEAYLQSLKYGTQVGDPAIKSFVDKARLLYDLAHADDIKPN
jgi:hypothetical protein